jgi:hypothetical protein
MNSYPTENAVLIAEGGCELLIIRKPKVAA